MKLLKAHQRAKPTGDNLFQLLRIWVGSSCSLGLLKISVVALAVGELDCKVISPRVKVWAEPSAVEAAAFEFSQTEDFLVAAESLTCPYAWGRYDILCLPPSFPYGGMENPCLTFATPTLLAGGWRESLSRLILL